MHVWANYAFADNVTEGSHLADFVDRGGHVVLGAFCTYTGGNCLSGRIMTDTWRYCPVTGGQNDLSLACGDGSCAGLGYEFCPNRGRHVVCHHVP